MSEATCRADAAKFCRRIPPTQDDAAAVAKAEQADEAGLTIPKPGAEKRIELF